MNDLNFLDDIYVGGSTNCVDITNKKYDNIIGNSISRLSTRVNGNYREIKLYDSWYILDEKFYYYKYTFAFYELLMSELFKYFKLNCPSYRIALNDDQYGIISENFRTKESMYFDYNELHDWKDAKKSGSLIEFRNFLSTFMDYDKSVSQLNELFRLLAVDFFSGQKDRRHYNILFDVLKKDNSLSLAPLTDNGSIFKDERLESIFYYGGNLTMPKTKEPTKKEIKSLELIDNNPELKNYLITCLDIDLNKVINDTLEKYFLNITYDERIEIINYFDIKKRIIENTLKLIK